MTNPTTPFNWQMPTSTDLVTDLPADFETFGQAVATSMADLLGGTTGQILAKASNTNMDFTWVTNDIGDITAVTAGTGLSGGGTSGDVTLSINTAVTADLTTAQTLTNKTLTSPVLTTPSISTIDAKGDLLAGTADNTIGRLAVGTNNQVLTADSTTATGLKWATASSGTFPVLTVSKYGSNFSTNSSAFVDMTGYSITRTPVSGTNNIEIKLTFTTTVSQGLTASIKLLANSTNLLENAVYLPYNGAQPTSVTLIWYASNVAAASTVFKAQMKVDVGTCTVYGVNSGYNSIFSTLEVY